LRVVEAVARKRLTVPLEAVALEDTVPLFQVRILVEARLLKALRNFLRELIQLRLVLVGRRKRLA